ncbi:putative methionine/alanine importer small subunit [Mumia flava]|uniref:Putative methionine/alanine importer small subunit n=1 Tax=Mumia flava TaxID=1348852 RepID=A0A2M9BF35_9ACTN|nr:methionine/alanine import family NSS transporter small subunit [Mumia flava]PJJ56563.1 putative methionine/alanine importer small subunit [Mumia flava]
MSGEAIAMMIVAILVIWGGLAVAVWNLSARSPEE